MKSEKDRDHEKIRNLTETLEREKQALREASFIRRDFQKEILEAQRRANLTDFELQLENLLRKRVASLQAFLDELKLQADKVANVVSTNAAILGVEEQLTQDLAVEVGKRAAAEEASAQRINTARQSIRAFSVSSRGATIGAPSAEHGGIVNAPRGKAVPIIAHGQERIIPANQSKGGGGLTFNMTVNNPSFQERGDLEQFREQIEKALRDVVRVYKLDIS